MGYAIPSEHRELNRRLGETLANIRNDLGYTQVEMADAMDISGPALCCREKGESEISAVELFKAAAFVNMPIEAFYVNVFGAKEAQE